jgi:acyl-coenzyme A thioesterase PaaI-like protein
MNADAGAPEGWRQLDLDDPFGARVGPIFVADPFAGDETEPARFGMRVLPHHCNFAGTGHGGMIATMLDIALGRGMAAVLDGRHTPTITLTIDYLRAAEPGDWLESRVRLLRRARSLIFGDAVLQGPQGAVARANAVFKIVTPRG